MPLLLVHWAQLQEIIYMIRRTRRPDSTFEQACGRLIAFYRNHNVKIGSVHEAQIILYLLKEVVVVLSTPVALHDVVYQLKNSRRAFCEHIHKTCFSDDDDAPGYFHSLLEYALAILPRAMRREFHRVIEVNTTRIYRHVLQKRNAFLTDRVQEYSTKPEDFCVACQTPGTELHGTMVFLSACRHYPLCTACSLQQWVSTSDARCPVCRAPF